MRYLSSMRGWLSLVGVLATLVIVALSLLLIIGHVIGRILMELGWSIWQKLLGVRDTVCFPNRMPIKYCLSMRWMRRRGDRVIVTTGKWKQRVPAATTCPSWERITLTYPVLEGPFFRSPQTLEVGDYGLDLFGGKPVLKCWHTAFEPGSLIDSAPIPNNAEQETVAMVPSVTRVVMGRRLQRPISVPLLPEGLALGIRPVALGAVCLVGGAASLDLP